MIHLSRETEALARRLASARDVSVDEAVRLAIEEMARAVGLEPEARKPRDQSPQAIAARRAAMDRFAEEISAMPTRDARSPQDIIDDLNAL